MKKSVITLLSIVSIAGTTELGILSQNVKAENSASTTTATASTPGDDQLYADDFPAINFKSGNWNESAQTSTDSTKTITIHDRRNNSDDWDLSVKANKFDIEGMSISFTDISTQKGNENNTTNSSNLTLNSSYQSLVSSSATNPSILTTVSFTPSLLIPNNSLKSKSDLKNDHTATLTWNLSSTPTTTSSSSQNN